MANTLTSLKTQRTKVNDSLLAICDNVYFQPPSNVRLNYPCILYSLGDIDDTYANNEVYLRDYTFNTTLIVEDIDDPIFEDYIVTITKSKNTLITDGLYHVYGEYTI